MKIVIHIFLLMSFIIGLGAAREDTFKAQYDWGLMLWRKGEYKQAINQLEEMSKRWPDSSVIYSLLGQFQIQMDDYGEAKKWFKKAEERDGNNPETHYYLGICSRELSLHKPPLFRQVEMKRSKEHFERVTQTFPDYKDVWYQFAVLDKYKRHYKDAVIKAETQARIKPSVPHIITGAHWLYDIFLNHKNPEEWLLEQEGYRADYFLAELYRREEKFRQADSILQNLIDCPIEYLKVPVFLSYARMYSQQNRGKDVQNSFYRAIDSLETVVEAALVFQDIKFVLTDTELDYYLSLNSMAELRRFFRLFWQRRNPVPAAPLNFRLIEHYRRLVYAEAYYRYDGERTWFNNPDKERYLRFPRVFNLNRTFNDKGLVYIRHGKPDDYAADVGENIPQNESWLYYEKGDKKKLIFHFFIDENATGNNWRLKADIPRALAFSRINWDKIFHRIYSAGYLDYLNVKTEMTELSKKDVLVGLNSDRHSWPKETKSLSFPFYLSSFKGRGDSTRCEIYYGLSSEDLLLKMDEGAAGDEIIWGFKAVDNHFNDIYKEVKRISLSDIRDMTDSLGMYIDQITFSSDTSRHLFSLYLQGIKENEKGGYTFRYHPPFYDDKSIKMSELELARTIQPSSDAGSFGKKGLSVVPQPDRTFYKNNPVYVYFELYNLPVEYGKKIQYTLEYNIETIKKYNQNIFSKIAGIFKKSKEKIFNRVERSSDQTDVIEYIALDLSAKDAGEYELTVRAKIPGKSSTVSSKAGFTLL